MVICNLDITHFIIAALKISLLNLDSPAFSCSLNRRGLIFQEENNDEIGFKRASCFISSIDGLHIKVHLTMIKLQKKKSINNF